MGGTLAQQDLEKIVEMAPGKTYRRTFEVADVYEYFCIPREAAGMVGTIVVEPAK